MRLYPIWVWRGREWVNSNLRNFKARRILDGNPSIQHVAILRSLAIRMTFIVEAIKDDCRLSEIRSSAIVAVFLARKLAAEGFEVSISAPTGDHYPPDKFNLLLTSRSFDS